MNSENMPFEMIREVRFENDDFFDQKIMIEKLDQLIQAWAGDLFRNGYIDAIPDPRMPGSKRWSMTSI